MSWVISAALMTRWALKPKALRTAASNRASANPTAAPELDELLLDELLLDELLLDELLLDELLLDELVLERAPEELLLELELEELVLLELVLVLLELVLVLLELELLDVDDELEELELDERLFVGAPLSLESFELQAATRKEHINANKILGTARLQAGLTARANALRSSYLLPICYAFRCPRYAQSRQFAASITFECSPLDAGYFTQRVKMSG